MLNPIELELENKEEITFNNYFSYLEIAEMPNTSLVSLLS